MPGKTRRNAVAVDHQPRRQAQALQGLVRWPGLEDFLTQLKLRMKGLVHIDLRKLIRLAERYGDEALGVAALKAHTAGRHTAGTVQRILERTYPLTDESDPVLPLGAEARVKHTADMIQDLRGARVDGSYKRTFRRYAKPDVLVLDEWGYQDFDVKATDDLFRLVSERHEKASTVIVANTGFRSWGRFFPSKAQAVATLDRLVDRATTLRFTGPSVRKPKDVHGEELSDESEAA